MNEDDLEALNALESEPSDNREKQREIERDTREALKEAAQWVGEELAKLGESYMLVEAMQLAVKSDKGWAKAAHTGGEEFKPVSGYHSVRDGAVLTFAPVMASNYTMMEMPLSEAMKNLSGLDDVVRQIGYERRVEEIAKAKVKAREALATQAREDAYGQTYGGW